MAAAGSRTLAEAEAAILSLVVGGLAASVAEGMRSGGGASTTAAGAGCDTPQSLLQDLGKAIEAEDVVDQGSARGEPSRGVAAFTASVAGAQTASSALLEACAHLQCCKDQVAFTFSVFVSLLVDHFGGQNLRTDVLVASPLLQNGSVSQSA